MKEELIKQAREDINRIDKELAQLFVQRMRAVEQVAEFKKAEARLLPPDTDYHSIQGLRLEARQKLDEIRPVSVGQASRISGVSPADTAVLLIWLEQRKGEGGNVL